MKKKYCIWVIVIFILSGCGSPQPKANQQAMETSNLSNKIIENNLKINTEEYIVYQYTKLLMSNDYIKALEFIDDGIKQKYYDKLIQYLELSIKYKYYEPVYGLFGKNINLEQIKQIPIDRVLATFLNISIRKNFKVDKFELAIENIQSNDNQSNVKLKERFFIPYINQWQSVSLNIKLKKQNNLWKIIEDSSIIKHLKNQSESIGRCQAKSFKVKDYNSSLETLNKKICTYREQIAKGVKIGTESPLPDYGIAITLTFEEVIRDEIFDNKYCMEFQKADSFSLTKDIVSDEVCKKFNITSDNSSHQEKQ